MQQGQRHVSLAQLIREYEALGYRFDRTMDCQATAQYMTGERTGERYPYLALYPVQADNGKSAWNIEARRDNNFRAMQALRNQIFSTMRDGRIIEV
jgi:hypothetical protein